MGEIRVKSDFIFTGNNISLILKRMISNYIHRIIQDVTSATAIHIAKRCNHHSHPTLSVAVSNVSSRLICSCVSWIQ